jgi:hypothetical protein
MVTIGICGGGPIHGTGGSVGAAIGERSVLILPARICSLFLFFLFFDLFLFYVIAHPLGRVGSTARL